MVNLCVSLTSRMAALRVPPGFIVILFSAIITHTDVVYGEYYAILYSNNPQYDF